MEVVKILQDEGFVVRDSRKVVGFCKSFAFWISWSTSR